MALTGHSVRTAPHRLLGRGRLSIPWFDFRHSYAAQAALLIAAYYAAAHLGYAFRFSGPVASIVWLPVGVGMAGLYLFGLRLWPAVVIGDLLVNNYSALPVGAAVGQSFGNLLEVVIGAALLRRFVSRRAPLDTATGVAGVFALAHARGRGQRDHRAAVAGPVSRDSRWIVPARGAHVVARRFLRRRDRAPARARVQRSVIASLAARAHRRGMRAVGGADRPQHGCRAGRRAVDLSGVPGADLGRVPVRSAWCDGRDRDQRRVHDVGRDRLFRGVHGQRERQHPLDPDLPRGRLPGDAGRSRACLRAGAARQERARVANPDRARGRRRAAPARAQPSRRRSGASRRARGSARAGRDTRRGGRPRPPRDRSRPRTTSCWSRSTSSASSSRGSSRRRSGSSVWRARSRTSPPGR